MKLWLLKRAETEVVGWDETRGVVVAAETEFDARELAATAATRGGDERSDAWRSITRTTCVELVPGDVARVVIVDFNAG